MLSDIAIGTSRALARVDLGRRDQWKTLGAGHARELAVLSTHQPPAMSTHDVNSYYKFEHDGRKPLMKLAGLAVQSLLFGIFITMVFAMLYLLSHRPPQRQSSALERPVNSWLIFGLTILTVTATGVNRLFPSRRLLTV